MNNFNNFLNHLNLFSNKQQPKPGLWVNGNSMPKSSLNELFNYPENQTDPASADTKIPHLDHDAASRSEYIKGFHNTNHADPQVAMTALNSPDASNETTLDYAKHADPQVAITALNSPMATSQTVDIASTHPDASVVMAALNHPMATSDTTHNGVGHPNPDVALMALNHPEADGGTIMYGKQHPASKVVAAAIGHPLRGGRAPDSNKQPIREETVCMHPPCFRKMRNKQNWMNYSDTDSSMTRIGKDIIGNETPIKVGAVAGGAVGTFLGGPAAGVLASGVGALGGVAYNALPHMLNKFSGDPELDTDFDRVQKRTEQEEQKRREDVSKANPDLAARMQEDPRNRPGIGKGIARAMNDMSRMQTKVNAANINENTRRSIFLNHLNSFSK
jgi:hypothetical protein